ISIDMISDVISQHLELAKIRILHNLNVYLTDYEIDLLNDYHSKEKKKQQKKSKIKNSNTIENDRVVVEEFSSLINNWTTEVLLRIKSAKILNQDELVKQL